MRYLNKDVMDALSPETFSKQYPYPWAGIKDIILPDQFIRLHESFPPLHKFAYQEHIKRQFGQRPHNRFYAIFEGFSFVRSHQDSAILKPEDLSDSWREFIEEILTDATYRRWVNSLVGTEKWKISLSWHVGIRGSEVSPHVDDMAKIGTHIFYFNTSEDWDEGWGGQFLVLGEKAISEKNPDVEDFIAVIPSMITDNRSVIFKNKENAWHGVKSLVCPEGKYRRLFNVIFEKT